MAGYSRQDVSNNIANGNVIDADDLDNEFDAVAAAFGAATGHNHDGTSNNGAPITVTGPAQEYLSTATGLRPKANNFYDLGGESLQWKDLFVAGTATISNVDINGGNIDNVIIGASTPAAGTFTTVTTSGNVTVGGVFNTSNVTATTAALTSATITTADVNGGNIDGTIIGASTPAAATFSTATVNGNIVVTGTVDGRDIATDGAKLDTIASNAEVNQNAFSSVVITGQQAVAADSKTDTLNFADGTGIALTTNATTDTITITNTAPDQTVVLTSGDINDLTISGTYPNFTITNTSPDQVVDLNAGTGISISGTYPTFTITNTEPNQDVNLIAGTGITISGTYPDITINSTVSEGALYTAGVGLVLDGTTFKHADTSTQPTVNNSGNTFIQDITLDEFGHITSIGSSTLTIDNPNNSTITVSAGTGLTGGGNFTTNQSFNESITLSATTLGTSTWQAGTSTTEGAVSPAKMKAAIDSLASGIGVGQTLQSVSRSLGTSYQNTTGSPIFVVISIISNGDKNPIEVSSNGSTWVHAGYQGATGRGDWTAYAIVPNNHYYRASNGGGTINAWSELR